MAFSPCGSKIISGSSGGKIHIYNTETGQKESHLDTHGKYVLSIAYRLDLGNTNHFYVLHSFSIIRVSPDLLN